MTGNFPTGRSKHHLSAKIFGVAVQYAKQRIRFTQSETFDLVFKSKHFPSLLTSLGSYTLAPKLKKHESLPDVPLTTPDKSLYQLERDVGFFCSANLQRN